VSDEAIPAQLGGDCLPQARFAVVGKIALLAMTMMRIKLLSGENE
jgi:hypothetical protein